MRTAFVISLALSLAGCGFDAIRNGGGLMGNKATTGGSFTIYENGRATVVETSPR